MFSKLLVGSLFVAWGLLVVIGCGGNNPETVTPGLGRVTLTVSWPQTRAIPTATQSIKVVAQVMQPENGPQVGVAVAQRPEGQSTSQIVLENLPSVRVRLTATAHASTDGTGAVLASGTTMVNVPENNSADASIAMEPVGTVASIAMDVESVSVGVGVRATLKARAFDADGNEVAVDPEDWDFQQSSNLVVWNVLQGGAGDEIELWGWNPGSYTMTVTLAETSLQTVVPVTVTPTGNLTQYFIRILELINGPTTVPIGDVGIADPENPMSGLASGFCDTKALQVWITSAGHGEGFVKHKILVHAPEIVGPFTAKLTFFPEISNAGGGSGSITLSWPGGTDTLNQDLGGDIQRFHDITVKHGDIIEVELAATASAPEDGSAQATGFVEIDAPDIGEAEADFYYLVNN